LIDYWLSTIGFDDLLFFFLFYLVSSSKLFISSGYSSFYYKFMGGHFKNNFGSNEN